MVSMWVNFILLAFCLVLIVMYFNLSIQGKNYILLSVTEHFKKTLENQSPMTQPPQPPQPPQLPPEVLCNITGMQEHDNQFSYQKILFIYISGNEMYCSIFNTLQEWITAYCECCLSRNLLVDVDDCYDSDDDVLLAHVAGKLKGM